jgi:hypothetical protein
VKVPPRAAQYRTEAILGSIRTERHLCKFMTEDGQMRPCHICGKQDTLEHITLFCVSPQIAWASMAERYEQLTGMKLKINAQLCLLGRVKNENPQKKIVNRLASTTLWWIYKTYYERKSLKTAWEIGRELNEMYKLGDRVQLGGKRKEKSVDVEKKTSSPKKERGNPKR